MKYYELDDEEKQILEEIERGEWKSVKDFAKRKKELMQIARNTLNKTRNINLRVSERVVAKLKAKAAKEGIPYQTLASSVLHRFANK
ncbi:MAG: CopG family antitoxin [Patescibacteria group bacterium]